MQAADEVEQLAVGAGLRQRVAVAVFLDPHRGGAHELGQPLPSGRSVDHVERRGDRTAGEAAHKMIDEC